MTTSTFRDYFSDGAEAYRAVRPSYPPELVDFIADAASDAELVWDAGCGNGQLSVPLTRRFQAVIATDASAAQLAQGWPHPRIRYVLLRSEEAPERHRPFSAVTAAQAAHWFDLPRFYQAVCGAAARDAVVALVSYGLFSVDPDVDRLVAEFYNDALDRFWPAERRHVEMGYADLPFPFTEIPAPRLVMTALWDSSRLLQYIGTWSAVRRLIAESPATEADAFRDRLLTLWPEGEARMICWPLSLRAGYVRPHRGPPTAHFDRCRTREVSPVGGEA